MNKKTVNKFFALSLILLCLINLSLCEKTINEQEPTTDDPEEKKKDRKELKDSIDATVEHLKELGTAESHHDDIKYQELREKISSEFLTNPEASYDQEFVTDLCFRFFMEEDPEHIREIKNKHANKTGDEDDESM